MNENMLVQCINTNLGQEQDIQDGSYFLFDSLHAGVESFTIITNSRYNKIKTYDETTDSEVEYHVDSSGFIR
jgi:hypothetical protein